MTVTVIGGGASGLMAALTAAKNGQRVYLLERQARVGKKLAVTGNGRCNLSNTSLDVTNYHGQNAGFAKPALEIYSPSIMLSFFNKLGLFTVTEADGRVYPLSNQAGSVVDVMRLAADEAGVRTITGFDVTAIEPRRSCGFTVRSADSDIDADKIIVCCGGMAGRRFGGVKCGYELLASLGHGTTKLYPSLVQIKTDTQYVRALKGVRADGSVELRCGGKTQAQSCGEIQFTEYGISGPAAFDVSRAAATASGNLTAHLDLLRAFSAAEIENTLFRKRDAMPRLTTENLLTGIVHNRLGRVILKYTGFDQNTPIADLCDTDVRAITAACKDFTLPVTGTLGFDDAQVTAGGAVTAEFDPNTMQSRRVPGLYAAGEVLDIDGDCGGYNLQWAWASGRLAGMTLD